mmetsp:Transcript_15893/g.17971  ORF Transcript_15893/g.17971 Transcript_15893/m.17971 type:complete len:284 (+) Transcript_15893:302-1153(+)
MDLLNKVNKNTHGLLPETLAQLTAIRNLQLQQLNSMGTAGTQNLYTNGLSFNSHANQMNLMPQTSSMPNLLGAANPFFPNVILAPHHLMNLVAQSQNAEKRKHFEYVGTDHLMANAQNMKKTKLYNPLLSLCESTNLLHNKTLDHGILNAQIMKKAKKKKSKKSKSKGEKSTSSKPVVHSSSYKGVHWNKACKAWRAQISVRGKTEHLGNFDSEIEAAREYDRRARELGRGGLNFDGVDSLQGSTTDATTKRRRDKKKSDKVGSTNQQTIQSENEGPLPENLD